MENRYAKYKHLLCEHVGERVLKITLNRPERLNATNEVLHHELVQVWLDVEDDDDVSVVILTGAGRAFSAGGDFEMLERNINDPATRARNWKSASKLVYNIINCSKPIISAIHGPVVGAGLAAALLADISIAARSAKIIDGHTRLGVAAGDHAAIIWPLLCGMAKAKYYLLTCEPIDGETAEKLGLVSLVVDDDQLQATALKVANRLVEGAPTAIRWTKYAMNNWLRMMGPTFDASVALEFLGFAGPEVREGLASHLEKRAPKFDPVSPI
ncbi:MAG: enoyl-CoA hydratase/isomerase family protein [Xanthobacteraceae bacterium]|jgi:enoyl-CoA hydratase